MGGSFVATFGIIFFYEQFGNSIPKVLLLFGLLCIAFTLTTHVGAKLIQKIGMKKMMIISIFFLVIMSLVRAWWDINPSLFLSIFFISFIIYKMLYWVPYDIEFTAFTKKGSRGKQVAIYYNVLSAFSVVVPVISGILLSQYGYDLLFYISSILVFLSVIPLFFMEETKESYDWNFLEMLKNMFKRKNRSIILGNFAVGAENAVSALIWPIFIFILLLENYTSVGLVISLVFITTFLFRFIIGFITDKYGNKISLRIGSFLHITGWISRLFVSTGPDIYIADSHYKTGRATNLVAFKSSVYDVADFNDHYVDEYTVLRTNAFLFGKGLMCLLSIILITLFSIKITFIIAMLSVILVSLVNKKIKVK